jgi:tellurite resistance protein
MTTTAKAGAGTAARTGPREWALPITLFSIPLGLAGLAGAWAAATQLLDAPRAPYEVVYAAATVIWFVFTVVYVVGTIRKDSSSFGLDLRHPLLGPLTAYIPVIALLLIGNYASVLGGVARWLTIAAVAALAINAAQLVAHWLATPFDQNALHPGYFLPVTAGPFIAAITLARMNDRTGAMALFGVGVYFWLLLGAVITGRLFFGSPLPPQFQPVLSILLSPAGTASLAWFALAAGRIDDVQAAIGGITVFMLLIQLFFVPDYLRLPFTAQHWVFTFPLAVLANMGVRWSAGLHFTGWEIVAWIGLIISTTVILTIVAGTVRDVVRWTRARRTT